MISSPNNATVRRVRRLRKRAERNKRGTFLVEGHRAVGVALASGATTHMVLHTTNAAKRHRQLLVDAEDAGARLQEVSERVMGVLSSAANPPDVLAVAKVPSPVGSGPGPLLVLDGVADPATVGSLLASAAASGIRRVLAVKGTADVYSSTAVRVGAGAHFAVGIGHAHSVEDSLATAPGSRAVTLADTGPAPWSVDLTGPLALIVGSGEERPSGDVVAVPPGPDGSAASLASRAAVVMFEARRQRETA